MDNTKGASISAVVILTIIATLILIWMFVSGLFIAPAQNKYDNLEEELYKSIPVEVGYGVEIKHDETMGDYLVSPSGKTLYVTSMEKCDSTCLQSWTPYLVPASMDGEANAVISVKKIGSINQQTYNKAPLYFYNQDTNKGDIKGHTVGGVWFVARP